jgi:Carboxypeptidase regulatory-like domain
MKRALMLSIAAALFVTAANAATIRGRVVLATGAPCRGAEAKAADAAKGESTSAYSDQEGMFYIHDVPPGRYVVIVTKGRARTAVNVTVTGAQYAEAGTLRVQ